MLSKSEYSNFTKHIKYPKSLISLFLMKMLIQMPDLTEHFEHA